MADYIFEDMTAEQAFGVGPGDLISVRSGSAMRTTVIFTENALYQVTIEGKTLLFPAAFRDIANGRFDGLVFPDGSRLHVGDSTANTFALTPNPNAPVSGAAYGGAGDDRFTSLGGDWLVQGNQGNDLVQLGDGRHTVYGGQDNDVIDLFTLAIGQHGQFAQGNKGDDSIAGAHGADTLLGGQGSDTIYGGGGADFLNGNLGDDVIRLQGSGGQAYGEDGSDTLSGGLGDLLDGGAGRDSLTASANDVTLRGGADNDFIQVNGGRNWIDGGDGDDSIFSFSSASQTIFGGGGHDDIYADRGGAKLIDGGAGNDQIQLGSGQSTAAGGAGDDIIITMGGANVLRGGDGSDYLAGQGNDDLDGGLGNDTIAAGGGVDTMRGGPGSDVFIFESDASGPAINQIDRILDWSMEDRILVRGIPRSNLIYEERTAPDLATALGQSASLAPNTVVVVQAGADVVIFAELYGNVRDVEPLILVGRTLADISANNFI